MYALFAKLKRIFSPTFVSLLCIFFIFGGGKVSCFASAMPEARVLPTDHGAVVDAVIPEAQGRLPSTPGVEDALSASTAAAPSSAASTIPDVQEREPIDSQARNCGA